MHGHTPKAGSIPACAGEPSRTPRDSSAPTVYPRVCGGTATGFGVCPCTRGLSVPAGVATRGSAVCPCTRGLSPRVRGNPAPSVAPGSQIRSIPACAGEPWHRGQRTGASGVYPRVCGGTRGWRNRIRGCRGLSPRVRGNRAHISDPAGCIGSIPACAGEPGWRISTIRQPPVYPRVCGGTVVQRPHQDALEGLSPRVRGNRWVSTVSAVPTGSIPACAGEPGCTGCICITRKVYPRVCGGTWRIGTGQSNPLGLSPRVRGNL